MEFDKVNLLIMGVGGVGKEHIRAARTLGVKNVSLCDTSEKVEEDYKVGLKKGYVYNEWDVHKEKIVLPENTEFLRNYWNTKRILTHAIIATPTSSHSEVVKHLKTHYNGLKILLEKPISEDNDKAEVDYVGYEYDYKFKEGSNVLVLCNSNMQPNNNKIENDLLSHLIYLALKNKRTIKDVCKDTSDYCHATTRDGDLLVAMRNQRRHFVFFNEMMNINYEELFTRQLERFIKGENNYRLALITESYL